MHPDPRVLLADVEPAGEAIERFTEGMDQAAYVSDFRTQRPSSGSSKSLVKY